jgi:hypothetical protein
MIVKRIAQIVWTDLRWSKAITGTPMGQGNKNRFIVLSVTLRQVGTNVNLDDTIRLRSLSNSRLSRSPYLPLSTIVFRFFVAKPLAAEPKPEDSLKTGEVSKRKPLETKKKSRIWFPGGRKERKRILRPPPSYRHGDQQTEIGAQGAQRDEGQTQKVIIL